MAEKNADSTSGNISKVEDNSDLNDGFADVGVNITKETHTDSKSQDCDADKLKNEDVDIKNECSSLKEITDIKINSVNDLADSTSDENLESKECTNTNPKMTVNETETNSPLDTPDIISKADTSLGSSNEIKEDVNIENTKYEPVELKEVATSLTDQSPNEEKLDLKSVCTSSNDESKISNVVLSNENLDDGDSIVVKKQSEFEEYNSLDRSENQDTVQPVILEVKSIAPDIVDTLSNTIEGDTNSENYEQVKKICKFEDGTKEDAGLNTIAFESFAVKSEIFEEEEEHITDVAYESEFRDDMEVDENVEHILEGTDEMKEIGSFSRENKPVTEHKDETQDFIMVDESKSDIKNINDKLFIREGSAEILLSSPKNVFYNPVQEFNRDMSIAALTVFAEDHQTDPRYKNRGVKRKNLQTESTNEEEDNLTSSTCIAGTKVDNGITILEALSATGLRSIRYAKEIPGVKQIIANDISELAVENIKKNAEHNGVGDIITTTNSDASLLMYQHRADDQLYDVIDLDPYGCPSRFLDAAVQAVRDGGILLVTCTDMAVLAGNSPETCHAKYGAISLRNPACHEMAIRIALQCIESHANRYGRYIVPLISFSADFYIRVIVQVYTSPVTCKKTTSKLSMVYQCVGCQALTLSPLGLATQVGNNQMKFTLPHSPPVNMCCSHCFYQHTIGGPIWSAPIHKVKFVDRMLKVAETQQFGTSKRMEGMLEVIKEELPDVPLYYTISGLCGKIHCIAIPIIDFRSALLNAGYRVSLSHASPNSIKTNAPIKSLWDIIRCWVQVNPISQRRLVDGSVSAAILFQEPTIIANFELHPKAKPNSRVRGLLRFQQNPQKNWGPGTRSRANVGDNLDERRIAKQNKKTKNTPVEIIEVITLSNDEDSINP